METEALATKSSQTKKEKVGTRGVFEKARGSGIWWIRYIDAEGRFRREKAGTKGMAIDPYRKRKTEALVSRVSRRIHYSAGH